MVKEKFLNKREQHLSRDGILREKVITENFKQIRLLDYVDIKNLIR